MTHASVPKRKWNDDVIALRGEAPPWRTLERWALALCVLLALALRLYRLAADGFADDEIHKWLAAERYLHGHFGGDDVEHPMLMKGLIALCALVLPRSWTPETLTRLPNVLAGAATVWALAQLGRRLFGRGTGLLAAAAWAVGTTAVGYGRIAKEDTPFTLFLVLLLWCFAEAKAASDDGRTSAQRRWELWAGALLGLMLVSKYVFFAPLIPLAAYLWLKGTGTRWHVPFSRWLALGGVALAVFLALDWIILLPATWQYLKDYLTGAHLGDRARSESLLFMGRLYDNMAFHYRGGTPFWFYAVFAAVKLAPPTVTLALGGLALALWRRSPSERIVLAWFGVFGFAVLVTSAKYGRYFLPLMPAVLLLMGSAAVELARGVTRALPSPRAAAPVAFGLAALVLGPELSASVRHAPFYRLHISALGGGDARVDFFFPHCDYFDTGIREAMSWVARRAEPNAVVASEVDWVVRYYAGRFGRTDLQSEPIIEDSACGQGGVCYVLVQPGRRYWHNEAALDALAQGAPEHVVSLAGRTAVRVYRLGPGQPLFPGSTSAHK